ncbi:MAG: flagellar biosynthesis protein FlgL [Rhizobiales bacterium]|nr:flagellar biosynthesis protein FlgL [Hyphomicrobiales bacterium]
MSVLSIGGQSTIAIQQLVNMRAQFDDLQRQLSTGQKSATYAGLGLDRGVTVSLNAQLTAIDGYNETINNVTNRISLMNVALTRMADIGSTVRSAIAQANTTNSVLNASVAQQTAHSSLDDILNGNGTQAGLKQLISERNQADLGANGLGRLTIAQPAATSVSLTEDAAPPFGLKLASVSSNLSNAVVTGPAGLPASLTVDMSGGLPNAGEAITVRFNLPDGSSENTTLTATASASPGANEFTIGATPAATAANLQSALATAIGKLAGGALAASSAVTASNEFFDADANNPPQRVAGPPFDSATAMTAGSATDTVIWYQGEAGSDPARATASARVDPSLAVSYGVRANENGIRALVQNIATLAAVTISPSDPNAAALSVALNQRLTGNLNGNPGDQTIKDIAVHLAGAQVSLTAAKSRHQQTTGALNDFLQQIQGVSNEEVGSQILALQTRMQASMQTTAMLFQTSLINYLK